MKKDNLRRYRDELTLLVSNIEKLNYPKLGPAFKNLAPDALHEALVAHRILKTYEVPSPSATVHRRDVSILEVLQRDGEGLTGFSLYSTPDAGDLYRARAWLHEFFRGFKHTYSSKFPKNETYVSSFGHVDLYYKLSSSEQWHISPDLIPYACKIILQDRGLGCVVRDRFRKKYGSWGIHVLRKFSRECFRRGLNIGRIRYEAFRLMLTATCTQTRVSRVTTVPKDNERDRVITCEALWTMVCQLSFALSLRRHLERKLGVHLHYLQTVHRSLIRAGGATIDLSKASDTNYMCVLKELYPKDIYSFLERIRTGIFETKDSDGDSKYSPLRMFAPMGCGCTFEVMTITLLAHARVLDPGASVFGDDIIISPDKASRFCENLVKMGWKVNVSKTFIDGPFRESCGSFCDLRTGKYLLSYDFRYPIDGDAAEILYRKIWNLGHALPSGPLRNLLVAHTARTLLLFPRDAYVVSGEKYVDLNSHFLPVPRELVSIRSDFATPVTDLICGFYHRRVEVRQHRRVARITRGHPCADRVLTYCFLRRGSSYEIPLRKEEVRQVPIDVWTGTPISGVLLVNVITT